MLKRLSGLGLMILLLTAAGVVKARAADIDIGFFYTELAPYGEWISLDPYGWVWCPYDLEPGWRPYTDGEWVYSDFGWTFISPVEWGWACYHYGRWSFDNDLGWFWVPGTVWGPAWVAWRHGGGYIGWAPLPPEVGWSFGIGLELGGFDLDYGLGWSRWSFCDESRFTDRHIGRYLINPARNVTLIRTTKNVTNYTVVNNRIIDNNVQISEIERATHRTVPHYRIAEAQAAGKIHPTQVRGTEIQMFRPRIAFNKTSIVPHNVLAPRFQASSPEKMAEKQQAQKAKMDNHYYTQLNELRQQHQQETKASSGVSREELNKRHQQEVQALEEQHKKEAQALENRQKREQQQQQQARSRTKKYEK